MSLRLPGVVVWIGICALAVWFWLPQLVDAIKFWHVPGLF